MLNAGYKEWIMRTRVYEMFYECGYDDDDFSADSIDRFMGLVDRVMLKIDEVEGVLGVGAYPGYLSEDGILLLGQLHDVVSELVVPVSKISVWLQLYISRIFDRMDYFNEVVLANMARHYGDDDLFDDIESDSYDDWVSIRDVTEGHYLFDVFGEYWLGMEGPGLATSIAGVGSHIVEIDPVFDNVSDEVYWEYWLNVREVFGKDASERYKDELGILGDLVKQAVDLNEKYTNLVADEMRKLVEQGESLDRLIR